MHQPTKTWKSLANPFCYGLTYTNVKCCLQAAGWVMNYKK